MKRIFLGLLLILTMGVISAQDEPMNPLVESNNSFAFDLYAQVADESNLMFSPYSIMQAIAVPYIGAEGETAEQIREALNFTLAQGEIAPEIAALNSLLTEREMPEMPEGDEAQGLEINIANALWGQDGFPFIDSYVDTINENFDAALRLVDFTSAPDEARVAINDWVAEQTEDRIQNILQEGAITPMTRMVLANAIYFNASWMNPFQEFATQDGAFTLLGGEEVNVPLMNQQESYFYAEGEGYQAITLPYLGGDMAMMVILPAEDTFADAQTMLTADFFNTILENQANQQVNLFLPRFEYEYEVELGQLLADLGMPIAFSNDADFSGMAEEPLAIDSVIHKSFVAVDETGTEAAAATVMTMRATSAMPMEEIVEMRVDRPFMYAIYDRITNTILFLGQVTDPS